MLDEASPSTGRLSRISVDEYWDRASRMTPIRYGIARLWVFFVVFIRDILLYNYLITIDNQPI